MLDLIVAFRFKTKVQCCTFNNEVDRIKLLNMFACHKCFYKFTKQMCNYISYKTYWYIFFETLFWTLFFVCFCFEVIIQIYQVKIVCCAFCCVSQFFPVSTTQFDKFSFAPCCLVLLQMFGFNKLLMSPRLN